MSIVDLSQTLQSPNKIGIHENRYINTLDSLYPSGIDRFADQHWLFISPQLHNPPRTCSRREAQTFLPTHFTPTFTASHFSVTRH